MSEQPITPEYLRSIGFRIDHTHVDNQPHMTLVLDPRQELALEVSLSTFRDRPESKWHCWLRSDLSHCRSRFVHVRYVWERWQLERLIEAITGQRPQRVEFDADQFAVAWSEEAADCQRRYAEYCQNARWPHVPGR